ncbi:MAG: hypothetical protein IKU00_08290 [Bacteroidales bacterium]|nr:hypothetical protein [Bacteroidales bacterium]
MKKIHVLLLCLMAMLLASCTPDEPNDPETVTIGKGVFVINEGSFTNGGSTLTFYDPEMDTVANRLFYRANDGAVLGDTGQSLALIDGMLYIVVNNSNIIYKVDANTIKCDLTKPYMITDFDSPRYMLAVAPNKAYVSDLMSTVLWIVNPQDMTHTGSIDMGKSTETMVQVGRELYVTNWSSYYVPGMENNTVQVVDIENDVKVAEITVGKEPNGMVADKNGKVWVLCEGAVWDANPESPSLWMIDPATKNASRMVEFEETAMNLAVDPSGSYLYYFRGGDYVNGGDVHRVSINNPTVEDAFVISGEGKMFYKIAVDPNSGDVYVTDAKNYTVDGEVYRYSSDGVLLSSFTAGICPGFMLFN